LRGGVPRAQEDAMQLLDILLDSLRPWLAAVIAAAATLLAALAGRIVRRPLFGAAAAGIGVLAGWWFAFGLLTATPRQLPERLPLMMLVLVVATPLAARLAPRWRWAAWPLVGLGVLWVGWWLGGAPRTLADLQRAAPVLAGAAAAMLLLALRAAPRWALPVAAAALFAGLLAAAPPGPPRLLGAVVLAASVAALAQPRGGAVHPALAALPMAGALAAVAALPVVGRGAPADWAAAAAPLAALWLGAPLGAWLARGAGAPVGALLVGAGCAALALLLR
jgi:hypothetical protein